MARAKTESFVLDLELSLNPHEEAVLKKKLKDRWNLIDGRRVQRDLYSAFLIANTTDSLDRIDVDRADQWYESFLERHDQEIRNIKQCGDKTLKWYVA